VSLVLEGARGNEKSRILDAIDSLRANGSTNGEGGLQKAYALASQNFIKGGNNRIIMASDGDLNVGISSESELNEFVSAKRKTGVYLSVLGFGAGNYKDNKMETLADNGNGNYHYIDSVQEAQKVFGEDLTANLVTVADDVKLQLKFDPAFIKGYRQIGYENRSMSNADFTNDKKDAAEMGAGHQAIVVYEIVMADSPIEIGTTDPIKLDGVTSNTTADDKPNDEWLTISLRYKDPGAAISKGFSYSLTSQAYTSEPDADWTFAASVVEFGMVVTGSDFSGSSSFEDAIALAEAGTKSSKERTEFVDLMRKLTGQSD
jgi:Ca-activated chloride channel family protein